MQELGESGFASNRCEEMMISKSNSKSQRSRRKMREAKHRLAAGQDAIKLGGTPWKFVDFELRPYAGKVEPSAVEELKAAKMDNATVGEKLMEVVAKIGEKIDIVRYEQ